MANPDVSEFLKNIRKIKKIRNAKAKNRIFEDHFSFRLQGS